MACEHVKLPGLGNAIVCGGRRRPKACMACDLRGTYQCDWKMPNGGLCNAFICPDHAKLVAPEKHLCPLHQEAFEAWKAARAAKQAPA